MPCSYITACWLLATDFISRSYTPQLGVHQVAIAVRKVCVTGLNLLSQELPAAGMTWKIAVAAYLIHHLKFLAPLIS